MANFTCLPRQASLSTDCFSLCVAASVFTHWTSIKRMFLHSFFLSFASISLLEVSNFEEFVVVDRRPGSLSQTYKLEFCKVLQRLPETRVYLLDIEITDTLTQSFRNF